MQSFLIRCKDLKMRGGKMIDLGDGREIDLNNFKAFVDHISNLKETSIDKRDGTLQYMTCSDREAINFDDVKNEYVKLLKVSETPKSNDALFDDGKGCLVFVEFKNGFMDDTKQFAVRKKVYDSVLIFADITSMRISDMRNYMKYILVYNEKANQDNNRDKELKKKREAAVQPSSSYDNFAKKISKYANKEYVCFGLRIFENYCFKEVHTYTEKEFEDYLSTL